MNELNGANGELLEALMVRCHLPRATAEQVMELHEARVEAERRQYDAWLLGKLIMRISEARSSRLAAVSLALALGVRELFFGGRVCRPAEMAEALGVDSTQLEGEVQRSADWMEIHDAEDFFI
jgi:hypothetical protein